MSLKLVQQRNHAMPTPVGQFLAIWQLITSGALLLVILIAPTYVFARDTNDNILAIPFDDDGYKIKEHTMLNITVGQVGILDNLDGPQRYGLEYRFKSFAGPYGFRLIPAIGAAGARNGARFFYSDLRHDFYLNRHWLVIPSFGIGVFKDGNDLHLGDTAEFRSGLEFAYRFNKGYRAGLAIFHLSNGGISSTNPGTEALVFSFSIPIDD